MKQQQYQTLASRLERVFSKSIQERGRVYFQQRRVSIAYSNENVLECIVRGTRNYWVTIRSEGTGIYLECNCPHFTDYADPCKHLWATILMADSKGILRGVLSNSVPIVLGLGDLDDESDSNERDDIEVRLEDVLPVSTITEDILKRLGIRDPRATVSRTVSQKDSWQSQLAKVEQTASLMSRNPLPKWPESRTVHYIIDLPASLSSQQLVIDVVGRDRKVNGDWGTMKSLSVDADQVLHLADSVDRNILTAFLGARVQPYSSSNSGVSRFYLSEASQQVLLPLVCSTGRCWLNKGAGKKYDELRWDDGGSWEFHIQASQPGKGKEKGEEKDVLLVGEVRRSKERVSIGELDLTLKSGFLILRGKLALLENIETVFPWIQHFRQTGKIVVPAAQWDTFLERLALFPGMPQLDLPENLKYQESVGSPQFGVHISQNDNTWKARKLLVELVFNYGGREIPADYVGAGVYLGGERRMIVRDQEAEAVAAARLHDLGVREGFDYYERRQKRELHPKRLPHLVSTLTAENWEVVADGKLYRQPGSLSIEVKSGVDWFELHGTVDFDGSIVNLPTLLAALKRGESSVILDDGTLGILPAEWLNRFGLIAGMGRADGEYLRFSRSQVGILDALLMAQPEVSVDATFKRMREELMQFKGVEPLDPSEKFTGTLRGYQREGLGWLMFLNRFGLGGCLADDMGTGKTIQVLALLESGREKRRDEMEKAAAERDAAKRSEASEKAAAPKRKGRPRKKPLNELPNVPEKIVGPSLVVVPKSLVFNWIQEAARFAPALRVLDHTGPQRSREVESFTDYDVVLTTYGILRSDAARFTQVRFDYAILDEAQAIKNASTAAAKAARLIDAEHRLAMSGTPVENHLGELWSLFEFLNPGLLGNSSILKGGPAARTIDEESLVVLRQGLRPFILRRTKEQVATDLPPKMEQTIYCEMEPTQRKLYNELRDHYRATLLGLIETRGIKGSKIQILEALLRLRQAACHPGLVDKKRVKEPSAKLDALLEQIDEVVDGGHKALIFSQFTSMLAIVRTHLDRQKIPYEYLDGRTRDRESHVERFQSDPECKLFLISLKAGGVGLNLTAADYVFLLDPWWNPAVEAQAIDRAHRIGQSAHVFAYRLIARDTVEEKVLELQQTKRDLADAIITADNSLIRTIGREDLEALLS